MNNTSRILLIISFVLMGGAGMSQTPLTGIKICLDPGHGGHDSNDRQTDLGLPIYYYESDATWEAMGYLDTLLQKLGAETKLTRITNDPESLDRDPSLSDRVQVSNSFGANYFHSFHTNGASNQSANYTLVLYAGAADGTPHDPQTLKMADILDDELFVYMRTTYTTNASDNEWLGFNLGVLKDLNAPGTLSEASFHSNIPEGRRLMNSRYRKAASWAVLKSILKFYDLPALETGEVGGIITDVNGSPVNGVEVTLNPGQPNEITYTGDQYLNGFYFFDWVPAGEYELLFSKFGFESKQQTVTVNGGGYTETDFQLTASGSPPSIPELTFIGGVGETGVEARWKANTELSLLGYRLYYASDDDMAIWNLVADENTLTKDLTSVILNSKQEFISVPGEEVNHFKLTAVSESGGESAAGFILSKTNHPNSDKILIVDGFDRRSGSYTETYHDFSAQYVRSIRDSKLANVSSSMNDLVESGDVVLTDYDMVLWFLGDESTSGETFSDGEQILVKSYLETGGNMLITGSEIGWDLDKSGATTDQSFYNEYLKADFVDDGSSALAPATGVTGTAFENLTLDFGVVYPEDYPDDISPVGGATAILDYAVTGANGGIAYKGVFGSGSVEGGLIYVSFPLETVIYAQLRPFIKKSLDYLEIGTYFPIPPVQPELWMVSALEDSISISWKANTDENLIGYRVYYSSDGTLSNWALVAEESVLNAGSTSLKTKFSDFVDVPSGKVNFFKLTAISEGGYESIQSDVYAANATNTNLKVLLVDGFDRFGGSGSYGQNSHSFMTRYADAILKKTDLSITTADNKAIENGEVDLLDYNILIWMLGDESQANITFSLTEQQKISRYLEEGGNLFVSGSEIGWDLYEKGDETDKAFYTNYLKADYVADGHENLRPATGVAGTVFEGLNILFGETYPEDYPDEIRPMSGAEAVLHYNGSSHFGGISYTGSYVENSKPASLVYFSFPLETAGISEMEEALSTIIDYFQVLQDQAPVALPDEATVAAGGSVELFVWQNDYDINYDLDTSSVAILSNPSEGVATVSNGVITFTADENSSGEFIFSYTLQDEAGLISNEAEVTVNVGGVLGISNEFFNHVKLFPNPTREQLFIEFPVKSNLDSDWNIELMDLNGRIIDINYEWLANDKVMFNVSRVPQGIYLVLIQGEQGRKILRWVKEN